MTIDHLSFASRDLAATRHFYEGQLGFPVLIHEWMLMQGAVHQFMGGDQQQAIGHTSDEDGPNGCSSEGQTPVEPGAAK